MNTNNATPGNTSIPIPESVRKMAEYLSELKFLHHKNQPSQGKTYSDRVEMLSQISEATAGWDKAIEPIFSSNGVSADLVTNKNTGERLIIVFEIDGPKRFFPITFLKVIESTDVQAETLKTMVQKAIGVGELTEKAA